MRLPTFVLLLVGCPVVSFANPIVPPSFQPDHQAFVAQFGELSTLTFDTMSLGLYPAELDFGGLTINSRSPLRVSSGPLGRVLQATQGAHTAQDVRLSFLAHIVELSVHVYQEELKAGADYDWLHFLVTDLNGSYRFDFRTNGGMTHLGIHGGSSPITGISYWGDLAGANHTIDTFRMSAPMRDTPLTPVPEPGTAVLVTLGIVAARRASRRQRCCGLDRGTASPMQRPTRSP